VEFISMRHVDAAHGSPYNFRHSFNQTADHLEKKRRNPRRWKEREHVNLDPYSKHDSDRSTGNPCELRDSLFDDLEVIIEVFLSSTGLLAMIYATTINLRTHGGLY
jgi:hypothetical protein